MYYYCRQSLLFDIHENIFTVHATKSLQKANKKLIVGIKIGLSIIYIYIYYARVL